MRVFQRPVHEPLRSGPFRLTFPMIGSGRMALPSLSVSPHRQSVRELGSVGSFEGALALA